MDDGVIDKHEQKEMDKAHRRQLESRGRGMAQVKAYRSAKWMAKVGGVVTLTYRSYHSPLHRLSSVFGARVLLDRS